MGMILENVWIEICLFLVAVLYYLYTVIQNKYKYFEERDIPYIKPLFFFGNTFKSTIGREQLSESISNLYNQSKDSKIIGMFQIMKPVLLITDPELVNQILIKDFSHFQDHFFKVDEKTNPLEGHLFNLQGDKWRTMRKKLSPTFTSGKLKWMFEQMRVCGDGLLKMIDKESEMGDIEAKDLMARFTTDVIGSCAFGYEPEAINDPNCRFRVMGKKVFNVTLKQALMLGFRFAFPELFLKIKFKTVPQEMTDFYSSVVSQSFEHRMKTGQSRNDFIQLLLQLKLKGKIEVDPKDREEISEELSVLDESSEDAIELTNEVLTAQAFIFLVAGFETSASSLSFTLYLLAKHPEVQEKAREEVRSIKRKYQGQFTYDALKEMTYLECCISESLRILPPINLLFRECNKNIVLDGKKIEKGISIMIPMRAIQMDPNYFPNPTEFKPERFMDGGDKIIPGSYLPFGGGPRICIARRFALLEIKLGLAMILENYTVKRSPKLIEPLEFNPRSFINQPINGLWMGFEKID